MTERVSSSLKGWGEIWGDSDQQVKRAIRRVKTFTGLNPDTFDGLTFSTRSVTHIVLPTEHKVVELEPSPEELIRAPRAIRRVFRDLGLQPENGVTLEYASWPWGFDFTVKPKEVTEDRVGIRLSTTPCRAAIIAPLESSYPWEVGKVILDTFSHGISDNRFLSLRGERARALIDAYGYIFRSMGPNNERSWHPDIVKILSESSNWGRTLVLSRGKSS